MTEATPTNNQVTGDLVWNHQTHFPRTLINFALAFAGLPETEVLMTSTLDQDACRFYPPRLYISRYAAEVFRTHPELRAVDIQDGDAIAFDPTRRTDPERRQLIAGELSAGGAGARVAEIIENFKKRPDKPSETVGKMWGKSERRSLLSDKKQGGN